jgi:hypothetical protein
MKKCICIKLTRCFDGDKSSFTLNKLYYYEIPFSDGMTYYLHNEGRRCTITKDCFYSLFQDLAYFREQRINKILHEN